MIKLNDLKMKPKDGQEVENSRIEKVEIGFNFHYNSPTLGVYFRNCCLFGGIYMGDEYLSNVSSVLLELFKEYMDSCESLNISDLFGKHCRVVYDGMKIVAIGHWNEDKWIFIDEVIELINDAKNK